MHGASHEVLGRLAVGGMAELYLARTTHDDGRQEVVVLKRILPHLAEDPEFVRMFRDEAYLAATLDHPNIVHVHDIGQDGEDYFFTMEYVHGENVRTIIKAAQKAETTLPLRHVIEIAKGVCEGLHYAHERTDDQGQPLRIVHRDVSPTNILVSFDGVVKIVDFGIAKAAAATHVTQAGMLKGKASYMSPEQCRAQPVDRRSDVFAIGILMYEMTTLTRLFRGDNELAVLHQILTGTVDAPSTRIDGYDPELERIVTKALSQQPEDRYPTALALREELERFEAMRGLSSSREALGAFLREICGERPFPWDDGDGDDDDEGLEALDESGTGSGLPTSMGNFEDEEDTQVNRRAPDLRTLVPGAPETWTEKPPPREEPDEATGTTNRRASPVAARPGAAPTGAPPVTPAPPVTGPRKPTPGRAGPTRGAARGLIANRPRLPGAPRGMGIPPSTVETAAVANPIDPRAESTTPMAQPAAARGPVVRKTLRRGAGADPQPPRPGRPPPGQAPRGKPLIRSGRTLTGAAGGLAGPLPARSGRTLPGAKESRDSSSGPPPVSARPPDPARSAPSGRTGPSTPPAGSTDRTEALTPEQARELRRLGKAASPPPPKIVPPAAPTPTPPGAPTPGTASGPQAWSGPGVEHTEIAPPRPTKGDDVDEGARTLAMPRFDRTMLSPPGQELPKGPMSWKSGEDALTKTQKSTTADASALTSTQKSPTTLTSTQRSPSAAFPTVGSVPSAELRRPEMRSPSPRPASTPRSLWVPVLVVVIVGLAGTAVWLWLSAAGATPSEPPSPAPATTPSSASTPESGPGSSTPSDLVPAPPTEDPGSGEDASAGSGAPAIDPATETSATPTASGDTGGSATPEPTAQTAGATTPEDDPGARPRIRRPRRPSSTGRDPSPDPDLPEIKPGRPVPP